MREQTDWILSDYIQSLKDKNQHSLEEFLQTALSDSNRYSHFRLYEMFVAAVQASCVSARPYTRDIVDDFMLYILGLDPPSVTDLIRPGNAHKNNQRASAEGVKLLSSINALSLNGFFSHAQSEYLVNLILSTSELGKEMALPESVVQKIDNLFRADNYTLESALGYRLYKVYQGRCQCQ